jgi:hypothetical protein
MRTINRHTSVFYRVFASRARWAQPGAHVEQRVRRLRQDQGQSVAVERRKRDVVAGPSSDGDYLGGGEASRARGATTSSWPSTTRAGSTSGASASAGRAMICGACCSGGRIGET